MAFLTSQKNDLLKVLEETGSELTDFDFKESKSEGLLRIASKRHPDYLFFLSLRPNSRGAPTYEAAWCPGGLTYREKASGVSFRSAASFLVAWVESMRRELEEPDLWAELEQRKPPPSILSSISSSDKNIRRKDARELTKRLKELEDRIYQEFRLEAEDRQYVKGEFEYLRKTAKSGRLTRKDWKLIFLSTMMGIATTLAMNPQQTKVLWRLVQSVMSALAGILPPTQ